ncbi:MAG: hypothetical protein HQK75_13785 [Candidatus Magnetomorum sp.]|nr:hypothetical protein [Candidatus Magnetomorum sp.]
MSDTPKFYSYHAFLFPFRWEINGDINVKIFIDAIKTAGWEYEAFTISESHKEKHYQNYNEFVYFYEFARDAIYNTKDLNDEHFFANNTCYQFNFKLFDSKYQIKTNGTLYELALNTITLKLYETGIAIISFHMKNNQYPSKQDVKNINDFGRRTYPQYLPLENIRNKLLPDYINITETNLCLIEDFSAYKKTVFNITDNHSPVDLPQFIKNLLGKQFSNKKEKNKIFVDPIIDDRMFTICWYGNTEEAKRLSTVENDYFSGKQYAYKYEIDTFWYEFIFVDSNNATCQSKTMRPELIKNHTYSRWIDYQTLFGITRYSLMILSSDLKTLEYNNADFILTHIQTMYHQLATLTLAQRSSILNFSKRATEISNNDHNISDQVSRLYKDFIQFKNKMLFNEVTAQEQGIEMYQKMIDHMKIMENNSILERMINDLHHYANLEEQKKQTIAETRKADEAQKTNWWISIISLYFLIPTFITGIFGMNIMNTSFIKLHSNNWLWTIYIFCSFGIAAIIHIFLKRQKTKKSKNQKKGNLNVVRF